MPSQYDYKKVAILYVDDEEKALVSFQRAFGDDFRIFTAANAQDGLAIIEKHGKEIGLLLTDQRMPGEKGVWLLERAKKLYPQMLRVLVTAFTDAAAAIEAINSGSIYKYIHKPWDPAQLELTLRQALEFYMVTAERDELLREKMSVLRNVMLADRVVSLGLLAAGLSHHIRNSMVAVKTFLELAPLKMAEEKNSAESLRDPDFWRDYHANVQGQIEKINTLLGDLRTASENNSDDPFSDAIQLQAAINAVLKKMEGAFVARKLTVQNQIAAGLPPLHVDKPKFERLFELLLKDELAMLPNGSHIVFAAEVLGEDMFITLTDDGPALPQESLRIILDPFRVTSGAPSEYGINLMACFFIAHHHGGKIEARNLPGSGNVITVRLPLKPAHAKDNSGGTDFFRKSVLNDGLWGKLGPGG
jgi:two-component system probable response regulator PhcQ